MDRENAMQIFFTKTGETTYRTIAVREDGVSVEVPAYDRTASIPHDLVHYLVERELKLNRGFWGSVADGALFSGIKVVAGRPHPRAGERSQAILREIGQQGTEAEVFAGELLKMVHAGADRNPATVNKRLAEMWKPAKGAREPLSVEEAQRVCSILREAEAQWQALEIGGTLQVEWRGERPGKR